MDKFVVFINDIPNGYEKYQALAAKKGGAIVSRPFNSVWAEKIYKTHMAWRINDKIHLPLKILWFNRFFDKKKLNHDDNVFFLFYESFHMAHYRECLLYLKRRYPNSKMVHIFTNPPGDDNFFKLKQVEDLYDYLITDISESAKKYDYFFYPINPYELPIASNNTNTSDVFFVGANKGRLTQLHSIYEKLSEEGLVCDFYITGVPDNEKKYPNAIHYNEWLDYDKVLDHIRNSKSILEIIQDNLNYYTFRVYEASLLHKKLITTNKSITHTELYNSSFICTVDTQEKDFDYIKQFIEAEIPETVFPNKEIWSFQRFASFIKDIDKERTNGDSSTKT